MSMQTQHVQGNPQAGWQVYLAFIGLVLRQCLIHFAFDVRVTEGYLAPEA